MIQPLEIDRNPTPGDQLFIEKGENLAWLNHAFQQFGNYADCYQNCAITLIDDALQNTAQRDYKIYPIVFLIRHYFELRLKELIQGINYLEKQTDEFPTGHQLQGLWATFQKRYSDVVEKLDPADPVILSLTDLIDEISGLDPDSMTFRYPVDQKGKNYSRPEYIDLDNLRQVYLRCCKVLDSMAMQVSQYSESLSEILSETYDYYNE
ncbi:hypothetical protein L0659_21440 [Dyadobacter sp. CY347]|nr:hypothetical protein [Dyadobacter sp. CY347]